MEKYYWIFELKSCVCAFKKKNEKEKQNLEKCNKKRFCSLSLELIIFKILPWKIRVFPFLCNETENVCLLRYLTVSCGDRMENILRKIPIIHLANACLITMKYVST